MCHFFPLASVIPFACGVSDECLKFKRKSNNHCVAVQFFSSSRLPPSAHSEHSHRLAFLIVVWLKQELLFFKISGNCCMLCELFAGGRLAEIQWIQKFNKRENLRCKTWLLEFGAMGLRRPECWCQLLFRSSFRLLLFPLPSSSPGKKTHTKEWKRERIRGKEPQVQCTFHNEEAVEP